jgi:hypothetical protein
LLAGRGASRAPVAFSWFTGKTKGWGSFQLVGKQDVAGAIVIVIDIVIDIGVALALGVVENARPMIGHFLWRRPLTLGHG